MKILGVDTGLTGACAVVELGADGPRVIAITAMPVVGVGARRRVDAIGLQQWLLETGPNHAIIEAAQAFPRQGTASIFRYGRAAGVAEGVIAACGIPIEYVSPAHWKRVFRLSADKEASRAFAIARFPDAHAYFARKRDHGAAEACLLALFGARIMFQFHPKPNTEAPVEAVS
jgi:crossover junction endodeoxyribonuclease RuvC